MTIIKPHVRSHISAFFLLIALVFIGGGSFYVYTYNSLADDRHDMIALKKEIVKAEEANAETKNELYQILNPSQLETVATHYGLVAEKRPEYLISTSQWQSDSFR